MHMFPPAPTHCVFVLCVASLTTTHCGRGNWCKAQLRNRGVVACLSGGLTKPEGKKELKNSGIEDYVWFLSS